MELKPHPDKSGKDRLKLFVFKLLASRHYMLFITLGFGMLFAKIGFTEFTIFGLIACITFFGIILQLIVKKKFGIYVYRKKKMSEAEAEIRASLGETGYASFRDLLRTPRVMWDVWLDWKKMRNDPEYARKVRAKNQNEKARIEAIKDVTPYYRTMEKIHLISSPSKLFWMFVSKMIERRWENRNKRNL